MATLRAQTGRCNRDSWILGFVLRGVLGATVLIPNLPLRALAVTVEEKNAIVEKLAPALEEDQILFRWQTRKEGEALVRKRTMSSASFRKTMAVPFNSSGHVGGGGVYAAGNFMSSSEFVDLRTDQKDPGSLIEVHIKKGTKWLNLADPLVVEQLRAADILANEVLGMKPEVVIKYDGVADWWLIKTREGVSYHPVNINHVAINQILNTPDSVLFGSNVKARRILFDLLAAQAKSIPESSRQQLAHWLVGVFCKAQKNQSVDDVALALVEMGTLTPEDIQKLEALKPHEFRSVTSRLAIAQVLDRNGSRAGLYPKLYRGFLQGFEEEILSINYGASSEIPSFAKASEAFDSLTPDLSDVSPDNFGRFMNLKVSAINPKAKSALLGIQKKLTQVKLAQPPSVDANACSRAFGEIYKASAQ